MTNLAWACPGCNLRKSDRVRALDPETAIVVDLFHPRRNVWEEHSRWEGHRLFGRTSVGRATINILGLNDTRRILIRRAEEIFELFPP